MLAFFEVVRNAWKFFHDPYWEGEKLTA